MILQPEQEFKGVFPRHRPAPATLFPAISPLVAVRVH